MVSEIVNGLIFFIIGILAIIAFLVLVYDRLIGIKRTFEELKIPRIIHQTVPDKNNIGSHVKSCMEKLKDMNSGWKHILYDDKEIDDFIKTKYPQVYADYMKINPKYGPAKADFFRYLIIYEYGGVYLDCKSGVSQPLDNILYSSDTFVFQCTDGCSHDAIKYFNGQEINQWVIIAEPKSPFLKAVIEQMIDNIRDPNMKSRKGKYGVLEITGPIMYTNTIAPLLDKYHHRQITPNSMTTPFIYSTMDVKYSGSDYSTKTHYSKLDDLIILD